MLGGEHNPFEGERGKVPMLCASKRPEVVVVAVLHRPRGPRSGPVPLAGRVGAVVACTRHLPSRQVPYRPFSGRLSVTL